MPYSLAKFRPGWKISLFTLLMFPVLVKLGLWQLDREQEKLALQQAYQQRELATPVPLGELGLGDVEYMPTVLAGHYDNTRMFLLDNSIYKGQPGFEVLSPFISDAGETILVNRGWTAQGRYRTDIPDVPAVDGEQNISGNVYVPLSDQLMLGAETPFSGWPRIIEELNPSLMFRELGLDPDTDKVFPYTIRLREGAAGVLVRNWPVINTAPEKHLGYAVQWFAMAAVLLVMFVYVGSRPESNTGNTDGEESPAP